ncbi:hypothetical protein J6590_100454, partial [Homalodisca vitripennis]
ASGRPTESAAEARADVNERKTSIEIVPISNRVEVKRCDAARPAVIGILEKDKITATTIPTAIPGNVSAFIPHIGISVVVKFESKYPESEGYEQQNSPDADIQVRSHIRLNPQWVQQKPKYHLNGKLMELMGTYVPGMELVYCGRRFGVLSASLDIRVYDSLPALTREAGSELASHPS